MELASLNVRMLAVDVAVVLCLLVASLHAYAMQDLPVLHVTFVFAKIIVVEMGFV